MASPVPPAAPVAVHKDDKNPRTPPPAARRDPSPPCQVPRSPKPAQDSPKHAEHSDESSKKDSDSFAEHREDQDAIDMETFNQILDLDDGDTYEFSREMVWAYFSQVKDTFKKMDAALNQEDADEMSALGHFLKGSSAALGVSKVQRSCEKMQHYGHLRDEDRGVDLTKPEALKLIRQMLEEAKRDYVEAEIWLKDWYQKNAKDPED